MNSKQAVRNLFRIILSWTTYKDGNDIKYITKEELRLLPRSSVHTFHKTGWFETLMTVVDFKATSTT